MIVVYSKRSVWTKAVIFANLTYINYARFPADFTLNDPWTSAGTAGHVQRTDGAKTRVGQPNDSRIIGDAQVVLFSSAARRPQHPCPSRAKGKAGLILDSPP